MDPITLTSSTLDLTDTKAAAVSHASSGDDNTHATARAHVTETNSFYLAADEGVPAGNTCASSTRKNLMGDLSVQATKGSEDNLAACSEDGNANSPEHSGFTTAISRAMSKELARPRLLAGHDSSQAMPSVSLGLKRALSTAGYWSCVCTCDVMHL